MNWKPILTEQLEAQKKHYGEVATLASTGDKFYAAEREMTEGVIKGIEYCIEALSAAPPSELVKAAEDAVFILRCLSVVDEKLTESWRDKADRAANQLMAVVDKQCPAPEPK